MSRRRCCCAGVCVIHDDAFFHADTTDITDDWNEVVGDWGIESIQLVEKYNDTIGTANALLICKNPVSADSGGEMYITITIQAADLVDGDVYHIYPACTNTSTVGTIKVTFAWDATPGEWTTTISAGGVDQDSYTAASTGSPSTYTLAVCVDREILMIKAWVDPTVNEYAAVVRWRRPGGRSLRRHRAQ